MTNWKKGTAMLRKELFVVLTGIFMFPLQAMAADFDGSKSLACAIVEAIECAPGEGCIKGWAEDLNLPQFLTVDFAKKLISGDRPNEGGRLEAEIVAQTTQDGSIILQGAQNGRGWNLTLEERNGRMTVTAAGRDEGFVLFGACTPNTK
ncbi:MAG: hypothetical protein V3S70_02530 [Gammaproteobacteria bacterium]